MPTTNHTSPEFDEMLAFAQTASIVEHLVSYRVEGELVAPYVLAGLALTLADELGEYGPDVLVDHIASATRMLKRQAADEAARAAVENAVSEAFGDEVAAVLTELEASDWELEAWEVDD
jgi:ABC-type molybdate transport system permease subunit